VTETLWQIFIDARAYFSATGPALSQSQLYQLCGSIQSCMLHQKVSGFTRTIWWLNILQNLSLIVQNALFAGTLGNEYS
jgi:hypothetical protein